MSIGWGGFQMPEIKIRDCLTGPAADLCVRTMLRIRAPGNHSRTLSLEEAHKEPRLPQMDESLFRSKAKLGAYDRYYLPMRSIAPRTRSSKQHDTGPKGQFPTAASEMPAVSLVADRVDS